MRLREQTKLKISAGHNFSSPHLLNLRERELGRPEQKQEQASFEQKAAMFDQRVKEMPDFLKTRVAILSRLWDKKTTAFLTRGANWGALIQKRIGSAARKTRRRASQNREFNFALPAHLPRFAFMAILVLFVTIPLQALLLYQSINGLRSGLQANLANAAAHINNLKENSGLDKIQPINTELLGLSREVGAIRSTFDRLGFLRVFLPDKFKLADAGARVAEQGIISLSKVTETALNFQSGRDSAGGLIRIANAELKTFSNYVNQTLGGKHKTGLAKLLTDRLSAANDIAAIVAELYGSKEPRHLLLIFQNPRELRATGGFAGSFALITAQDGSIQSISAPEGGTYAIQGQNPSNHISPQPLHLINPRFEFQDANWWPDFPRSARKIAGLYETAGGPTIDAVIAITARVGEELLRLHGPLATEQGELNVKNFIDTLQETIARDRAQDRKAPKKIITSLIPAMQGIVTKTAKEHPQDLLFSIIKSFEKKDIQLWARSEQAQAALRRLGWSGELKNTDGDYLAVITSNIGGGKTDGVIKETIKHKIYIQNDNIARETLQIQRAHQGAKGDQFEGLRNVSYVRVYVPENARFIEAVGNAPPPEYIFEQPSRELSPDPEVRSGELGIITDVKSKTQIWQESGKKVFGFWMITDPGEKSEITLQYEVPLRTNGSITPYSLTIDPQGGKQTEFEGQIVLGDAIKTLTASQGGAWQANGWKYKGTLDKTLVTSGMLYRL